MTLVSKYFKVLKTKFPNLYFKWIYFKAPQKPRVVYFCPRHNKWYNTDYYSLKRSKYGCLSCSQEKYKTLDDYINVLSEEVKRKYEFLELTDIQGQVAVKVKCKDCGNLFVSSLLHKKGLGESLGCKNCYRKLQKERANSWEDKKEKYIKDFQKTNSEYELIDVIKEKSYYYYKLKCNKHNHIWKVAVFDFIKRQTKCKYCAHEIQGQKNRKTFEYYVEKAKEVHKDKYTYLGCEWTNNGTFLEIKCNQCGNIWKTLVGNHITSKTGCPKCSNSGVSRQEKEIVEFLKSLGVKSILQNDRRLIAPYELDIVLPDYNIAIEFNGLYWHSEKVNDDLYHIEKKRKRAEEKGIRVINIYWDDWQEKKLLIQNYLKAQLGFIKNKIYGRKCKIKEIDSKTYAQFNKENHLMSNRNAKYKIALTYEDNIVAVAGFSDFELIRYTVKQDLLVIGGLGKITKWFLKNVNKKLFTYVDLDYFTGEGYKKVGFTPIKVTRPKLWFTDMVKRYSREQFQKHKLKDKFENFDNKLTAREICNLNGFYRIFGCSNLKLEINKTEQK